jgi:DNA-binding winged helix-turn-helix (wHTH) protein/tetratricopeptide (TPR) repeat protein
MSTSTSPDAVYVFGAYRLDVARSLLTSGGAPIPLTPRLRDTLACLLENPGRLVTKEELLSAVWPGRIADEANLTQAISGLRKALGPTGEGLILTEPGRGYRFRGEVARVAALPPTGPPPTTPIPGTRARPRWLVAATAVGAAALVAVVAVVALRAARHPPPAGVRVVVADFQNTTGDPAFDHILRKAFQADLAQSPFLTATSDSRVAETLALMGKPKDAPLALDVAREVCERNNGGVVVSGGVARLGARYLLTVSAADCASGDSLDEEKRETDSKDGVAGAIDALAADIRRKLGESQASVTRFGVPLMAEKTASFEALRAYSEGMWLHDHGRVTEAVAQFQHAVEIDPNFVMAYTDLSTAYFNLREPAKDRDAISRAYQLRNLVSEAQRFYISERYQQSVMKDNEESIRILRAWSETYPRDSRALVNLSNQEAWLGDYPQAIIDARQALALGETSTAAYFGLIHALEHAGRFAEASAWIDKAQAVGVTGGAIQDQAIRIAFLTKGPDAARQLIDKAAGKPWERDALVAGADIALTRGRLQEAFAYEDRAVEVSRQQGVVLDPTSWKVSALAMLGLNAQARTIVSGRTSDFHPQDFLYAMATLGDADRAERELRALIAARPSDTLLNQQAAPRIRAAIALRQGHAAEAVRILQQTVPYQLRDFDSIYLRANAEMAASNPAAAEAAFRLILAHPGVSIDPQYPLAHLGLARALRAEGRLPEAKSEYQAFLSAWKDADPDLPVLAAARSEYARLG